MGDKGRNGDDIVRGAAMSAIFTAHFCQHLLRSARTATSHLPLLDEERRCFEVSFVLPLSGVRCSRATIWSAPPKNMHLNTLQVGISVVLCGGQRWGLRMGLNAVHTFSQQRELKTGCSVRACVCVCLWISWYVTELQLKSNQFEANSDVNNTLWDWICRLSSTRTQPDTVVKKRRQ